MALLVFPSMLLWWPLDNYNGGNSGGWRWWWHCMVVFRFTVLIDELIERRKRRKNVEMDYMCLRFSLYFYFCFYFNTCAQ